MDSVHGLINVERRKRGLQPLYWSRMCQYNAQESVRVCAEQNLLFHSMRSGQFGENLAQGGSRFSPEAIVGCWMRSRKGHRENLLNPKTMKAGVGIARRSGKTFVSWVFSSQSPSFPDCPALRPKRYRYKQWRRSGGILAFIRRFFLG